MSSSSDANLIQALNNVSTQINHFFAIFILIFGSIGNILNCLVLSQRALRSNPCAFLFLIASIFNLISILVGVPSRILAGWNMDPTNTSTWFCKTRAFLVFTSRTIAFWLIVLATIGRWLSSSTEVNHRQLSTLKNVKRSILMVIFLSISLYVQMFYCYETNLINTPLKCYGKTFACRLITDLIYSFITIVLPLLLMFLFGLRTIVNVRQLHQRTQTMNVRFVIHSSNHGIHINIQNQQRQRRIDHHVLLMLLFELIVSIFFTLPQAIEKLYSTYTIDFTKSEYHNAIDSLIYNIVLLLSFLASSMPFYIYTLAGGTVFRNELNNLSRTSYNKLTHLICT